MVQNAMVELQASNNTSNEWNIHTIHQRCVKARSNDDLKDAYTDWTPSYDKDVMSQGYKAPLRVPELAMEYIRTMYDLASSTPIRICDAGCGTGLTTDILRRLLSYEQINAFIMGADLSSSMLRVAESRGIYDRCIEHDLNKPIPGAAFDVIVSTGLFLEGHCGPKALYNCLKKLNIRGIAIISIRQKSFDAQADEFNAAISDTGCAIESNKLLPYLGPIEANFIVIRKQ